MDKLKEQVEEGIMAGVREASANLFKVARCGDKSRREHAHDGMVEIRDTTAMMLELIEEVFSEEGKA